MTSVADAWLAKRSAIGSAFLGGPPFPANDSSVLVDIGISALNPGNTWTNLPAGFTYTAGVGSSIDAIVGLVPGSLGGNQAGRVAGVNVFPATPGTSGTVYIRLPRAALSIDGSQSSATVFYDATGNPLYTAGTYVPSCWMLDNGAGKNIVAWTGGGRYDINNNSSFFQPGATVINAAVSLASPNIDPTYCDYVFTWNGTLCHAYVDGVLLFTATYLGGQFPTGIFTNVGIGNYYNGAQPSLGGNLGPFAIQRFQISTAYCPPPVMPITVGVYGDSYCAGAVGGDGGVPGTATIASINAAQSHQFVGANQVNGSYLGQNTWSDLLLGYAYKQLGAYFSFYGACKAGYSSYYTGYGSPIGKPGQTVYWDALNAAQPEIVLHIDSVNNLFEYPGDGLTNPVSDATTMFNYWANGNPKLRAILVLECPSIELVPEPAAGAPISNAKMVQVAVSFRALMRGAFGNGVRAGTRGVPVTYIKSYESYTAAVDGARMVLGSHPQNPATSGSTQGPLGTAPNIHPDPEGQIRLADLIWPYLKTALLAPPY